MCLFERGTFLHDIQLVYRRRKHTTIPPMRQAGEDLFRLSGAQDVHGRAPEIKI